LVLGMFSSTAQINLNACDPYTANQDLVLNIESVDVTNRNVYQTNPITGDQPCPGFGACEFRIAWSVSNNRWEILADDGDGDFATATVLYYNRAAAAPNPPSLSLGAWEENIVETLGECSGIDRLDGDVQTTLTSGNTAPLAASFTTADGPYENITYTFTTAAFGYSDSDGDALDYLLIESLPTAGTLYLDTNNNNTLDAGEAVSVNAQITKAALDAGDLQYIQNGSTDTSFQFEVNDGTDTSSGDYTAKLVIIAVPEVTLSLSPNTKTESVTTPNTITASLSNAYAAPVTVALGFGGTAIGSSVDYTLSGTTITIPAGSTTGNVTLVTVPDELYEQNETVIIDITSVTNGVESGTQQVTFTIVGDDTPPIVSLEVLPKYNPIADESGGIAYVRGKLSKPSAVPVSIPLIFSGTATGGGTDYSITNSLISIYPLQTLDSIRVTSLFDGVKEGDESIIITMGTPTGGIKGTPDQVTLTIIDEDATPPSITSVSVPANGTYGSGMYLDFTVNFSEPVVVNTVGGIPSLSVDIGGTTRNATYISGGGSASLVFRYTVQTGDLDLDGIAVAGLSLNGGSIQSGTGADANLTLNSVGSTAGVLVDAVAPAGYSVAWDDLLINSNEATGTSFTVSGAETGATLFYSISSSGDGNTVTISGNQLVTTTTHVFNVDVSSLTDGNLTIQIYLRDVAGNSGVNAFDNSAILDQTPPATLGIPDLAAVSDTGISDTDNLTSVTLPTFVGTAAANSEVRLYNGSTQIGSGTTDASGNWSITATVALAENANSITATVLDAAGNESAASAALIVSVDTQAPDAPYSLVLLSDTGISDTDAITSDSTPLIDGSMSLSSAIRLLSDIDGVVGTTSSAFGRWSITTSTLSEGIHNLTAVAIDAAGNISAASAALSVEIDVTPPAIPGVPDLTAASDTGLSNTDNITNDLMPALSGTAEAFAEVALTSDLMGALGTATADAGGNWSFTASTAMTAGIHTITAAATDVAGNTSLSSPALTVTFDNQAPNLSLIAGLSLQLDANGITPVITASDLLATPVTDDFTVSTALQLSIDQTQFDCSETGANTVQVTATDVAGNTAVSTTTAQVVDLVNPTVVAKSAITLNVEAFETVALTTAMIEEGSTDNCGIQSQVLSKTIFDRTDEGVNTVTYTVTDTSGNPSQVTIAVTIVVIPKQLDVTVIAGQSKVYGAFDPVFSFTATGFEGGDDVSVLTGALSRDPGANVGTYSINQGTLDAGPNYTINFTGADFEITPATLNVSAVSSQSKVYGEPDPELFYVASGLRNGDSRTLVTGSLSRAPGEDVGSYPINQGTLDAGANYTINFIPSNFTITPADLLVTADNKTKVYGEADPVYTASYSGFVNSDTEAALGGSLSFSREPGEDVGSYLITPSGLTSTNYSISYATGALEITPADLLVTADNKTKVYGDADPAFSVSYAGFVNGDTEAALGGSLSFSREPGEDVGSYLITPSGLTSTNYSISYATGALEITKADLLVTADNTAKVYGETDPAFTVSYAGFVNADTEAALGGSLSLSRELGEDVGSYLITPSGLTSTNYTISYATGTLEITPADLLVTADNKTKVYGDADPAFTVSYAGFVNADTEAALIGSLSFSREPGEDVGSYLITPSGLTSTNYTINYATGALEITKADLLVTADNKTKVYGDADPAFTVSYAGFVNADTEAALGGSLSFSREPGEDVGSYVITASGYTSPNYTITYTEGILAITQASQAITFAALPVLNLESDADFQLQATASSGLPVTYTYSYTTAVPAAMVTEGGFVSLVQSGSIIITASQAGNQNYLPATPVAQELVITSSDASVHSLTIGEQEYLNPGSLITYVIECGADVQSLDISFITEANAQSTLGKNFSVDVPAPGIYRTTFTITSQDGTQTQSFTIEINKRFLFEEIVVQKFNNTLLVNNNPSTNGGYRFVGYRWFKNERMLGNAQYFSEGDESSDRLDPLAAYRVEMILENGDVLSTCTFNIELEATGKIQLAPNPVRAHASTTLYADFDADELKDMKISILSLQGTLIDTFYTSSAESAIQMPAGIQAGVYLLVCETSKQTQTVQFIVH